MKIKLKEKIILKDSKKNLSIWGFSKEGLLSNSKGESYFSSQLLLIFLILLPIHPKTGYIL